MNAPILAVEAALDALDTAIRVADAQAIFAASEALAVAVRALDASPMTGSRSADLATLTNLLIRLDAMAIEVNLHSGWTRQRIDSLADLRGQRQLASHRYC